MAIRKFKPHETITTEQLNKLVDAYNSIEFTKEELEQLLIKAQKQNEDNQSVINAFVSSFADIVKEQPSVLNTLELFSALRNSGPLASYGYRSETIPFSVFYGNDAEINSRAKVNGQWLININAGTIQLDIETTQNNIERIVINGQVSPITQTIGIDPINKTWTIDGNDTGVVAEGIGLQGYQGLQGKPGKTIRLETSETDPLDITHGMGQSELEQNVFMSAAKIWNNKIYAPYVSINQNGVVGLYQEVADLNIQYEILDSNGKGFYDDGASTNMNDYTYYINGVNSGVRAIGPKGDKGEKGDNWYVHTYYSNIDLTSENHNLFFDNLQYFNNESANYLVVVSGSKKDPDGVPLFATRPTINQLKTFYNNGDIDPLEFAIYTIGIKPSVLVPMLVSNEEGFTLSWIFKTDATINELPVVELKHGRSIEPVGKYETKGEAILEAHSSGRKYGTYILNINENNIPDPSRDYLWTYNENIASDALFYLGRLTGERGLQGEQGEQGEQGDKGEVGATGPRGGMPFNLISPYLLTNDEGSVVTTFCQSPTGAEIQAGDFIIDNIGKMAVVTSITLDTNKRANYYVFADLMGPEGPRGEQGEQGEKGDVTEVYFRIHEGKLQQSTNHRQSWEDLYDLLNLKGEQGERGEKGDTGERGQDGRDGRDGRDAVDGRDGKDGKDGKDGLPGPEGKPGPRGEEGKAGKSISITGYVTDISNLTALAITANEHDAYILNDDSSPLNGHLFIYDGVKFNDVGSVQGPKGETGQDGADGADGRDGADGADGRDGAGGRDGIDGQDGADGNDGRSITNVETLFVADPTTVQPASGYTNLAAAITFWNSTNKYLWKKTKITFSFGVVEESFYEIAAVYGQKGDDGNTPFIGSNGNWWLDINTDTGVKARGDDGNDGEIPTIDEQTGNWKINGIVTDYRAVAIDGVDGEDGQDGITPTINVETGTWIIDGTVTELKAVPKDGETPSVDTSSGNWKIGDTVTEHKAIGIDGDYVDEIVTTFKASSSTTQPTSGWATLATESAKLNATTKYLWKKTVYTLEPSGDTKTTYEIVAVHGAKGETGAVGASFSYDNTNSDGVLSITTNS